MLLTLSVARTVGYAAVDELTVDSFILCAAALPAMGIGLLVGDRIHSGLSQQAFQRVVCAALFLCEVPLLSSKRSHGAGFGEQPLMLVASAPGDEIVIPGFTYVAAVRRGATRRDAARVSYGHDA
jgi:hypothetical protein